MLEGFEQFKFGPEGPSALLSSSGLTFNKAAVVCLGNPEWVDVYRKTETREIAIVPAAEKTVYSFQFYNPAKKNANVVRWTSKELLTMIDLDMNWDHKKQTFRIHADYIPEENSLILKMSEAIEIL